VGDVVVATVSLLPAVDEVATGIDRERVVDEVNPTT